MKQTTTLSLLFISVTILTSCNKTDVPAPPSSPTASPPTISKDYSVSIKEKNWGGEITYKGKTTEYYSVYFKSDGTLLWSQLSSDYPGHWVVKEKELTVTLDLNSVTIKGTISDDDKLLNISDNTESLSVNNSAIVANPNINLDNTTRVGYLLTSPPYSLLLTFMPGSKVEVKFNDIAYEMPVSYFRSPSGGSFRILAYVPYVGITYIFGVVAPTGEIKGTVLKSGADVPWYLSKL